MNMSERAHAAAPDVDAERERREDEEDDDLMERLERRRGADSTRMRRARAPRIYFEFARVASEEQLERFEQYKRSKLPRAAMRKLMQDVVGSSTERCAIILSSLAKSYVGELVETAREAATKAGEEGPLQPRHLRAAQRAAQRNGTVPQSAIHKRRLFWRTNSGA
ncbi:hypothetical protein EMIHUDRAFT_195022 [Emiliania huxleyi CCMP1516]|uniref:TAFII28-like protein domain-containing protein n=2 Tax=Emiliania huxleyi TaxID=2903 RepID=A0A0D3JGR9_EMIH1|nr:hypothetical protein EMIHUDRAFT_195022 [Emiliania huxleyi CCMP1516]EOD22704.1 hypothetical protein EMIHUDRAFT_195022 [Emiliania huxleyi CCMP1516]|eukprot:XP_005775133.1 hypothetical protein EMIHUDRAFT_195022 [Emiliania huxleyi CCMP1516]